MIEAKHIGFGNRLLPLSFLAKQGDVIHLLGANGSGKSTLLGLLSGLTQGQGEVYLNKVNLKKMDRHFLALQRAYLSQQQNTAFALGVYQYLQLGLSALHLLDKDLLDKAKTQGVIEQVCEMLAIGDKLQRNTDELSGGEWQRVRIASVCLQVHPDLNRQARLLLLDEPTSGLDIRQQENFHKLINLLVEKGLTVIMSNHDINQSLFHSNHVLLLRNGHLVGQGCPRCILDNQMLESVFGIKSKIIDLNGRKVFLPF